MTLVHISTPTVVEPPRPKSSRSKSGTSDRSKSESSSSFAATPIISASGISVRKISSVPLSSRRASSTIITVNLFSIFYNFGKVKSIIVPATSERASIRPPYFPVKSSCNLTISFATRNSIPATPEAGIFLLVGTKRSAISSLERTVLLSTSSIHTVSPLSDARNNRVPALPLPTTASSVWY